MDNGAVRICMHKLNQMEYRPHYLNLTRFLTDERGIYENGTQWTLWQTRTRINITERDMFSSSTWQPILGVWARRIITFVFLIVCCCLFLGNGTDVLAKKPMLEPGKYFYGESTACCEIYTIFRRCRFLNTWLSNVNSQTLRIRRWTLLSVLSRRSAKLNFRLYQDYVGTLMMRFWHKNKVRCSYRFGCYRIFRT